MRMANLVLMALLPLPACAADTLPEFRPGLWEFRRSVDGGGGKPAALTTQKCTDPTADMQKKTESLITAGCKPTPVTKNGNRYSFSLNDAAAAIENAVTKAINAGKKLAEKGVKATVINNPFINRVDVETIGMGSPSQEARIKARSRNQFRERVTRRFVIIPQ